MIGNIIFSLHDYCRATRNPYNTSKVTGGSSSGSAAVVSAGLCPAALGVDGGGKQFLLIMYWALFFQHHAS